VIFKSAYSARERVSVSFPEQGRTKQSFKDECDVNNIMKRFQRTGVVDFVNTHSPRFGDATAPDFMECMNVVIAGKEMFADLPSSLRKRFGNDPQELMSFLEDPANFDEGVKLGLVQPRVEPDIPDPVPEPSKPV